MIDLNVAERRLHLDVDESELDIRRAAWKPPEPPSIRGYCKLYFDHVTQADRGADLDFLIGASGVSVMRESH